MKQLSIEERHEVYKDALKRIKLNQSSFICTAIDMSLWYSKFRDYDIDDIPEIMPEFAAYKPVGICVYELWWPENDKQSRIDCLTKCIELTAPKP